HIDQYIKAHDSHAASVGEVIINHVSLQFHIPCDYRTALQYLPLTSVHQINNGTHVERHVHILAPQGLKLSGLACVIGCQCKWGYVLNSAEECVLPSEC
ncbi:uncharacterized protein LOC105427970, partial [Pogonomyrmex barbatus]|uniref:Uncharacterized protein LOC105427970 n=1 Tax=Pogonomyrmex barbatus TaxID=144034 RepID=A0A6I9X1W4_9HYME